MGNLPALEILVVEDSPIVRDAIYRLLTRRHFSVVAVDNVATAIDNLEQRFFDLVISDYRMEPTNGLELLKVIKRRWPGTEVIIVTGYGSIQMGVEAMKCGAFDFITKPFENKTLLELVDRFVEDRQRMEVTTRHRDQVRKRPEFDAIIGESDALLELLEVTARIATVDSTVLITGESGTGKELIARAIHRASSRCEASFVAVNCGAIPDSLQESELFGHVKGAYTGAHSDKAGLVEQVDGGVIFLDEISDASPAIQVMLLRFLQEGEFRRVGDNRTREVDVRLITATNKDLEKEVEAGAYREDFYYRINVIPLRVPPLRERREDIAVLCRHIIRSYCVANNRPEMKLTNRALSMLRNYDWPGNIRELENVIHGAVAMASGSELRAELFPEKIRKRSAELASASGKLAHIENEVILEALELMQGNRQKTAEYLGISKTTLWRKLKYLGSSAG